MTPTPMRIIAPTSVHEILVALMIQTAIGVAQKEARMTMRQGFAAKDQLRVAGETDG